MNKSTGKKFFVGVLKRKKGVIMAIRPVSSVSFNNYNNSVNFEGKKKQQGEHSRATSPLKAVPLAALIAMSPMTVSSTEYDNDYILANIENVSETNDVDEIAGERKVIEANKFYNNPRLKDERFGVTTIQLVSTDGDDNTIETIALSYLKRKSDGTKSFKIITPIKIVKNSSDNELLIFGIGKSVNEYRYTDNNGNSDIGRFEHEGYTTVAGTGRKYLMDFANSPRNNGAIEIVEVNSHEFDLIKREVFDAPAFTNDLKHRLGMQ